MELKKFCGWPLKSHPGIKVHLYSDRVQVGSLPSYIITISSQTAQSAQMEKHPMISHHYKLTLLHAWQVSQNCSKSRLAVKAAYCPNDLH